MQDYELVMVITPQLEDKDAQAILEKVSHWVEEKGGELTKAEMWGRRKLAYHIKHFEEGNYALAQFKVDPHQVGELEANLRLQEPVIRHLLVKLGE